MRDICKAFGAVQALNNVDFVLRPGRDPRAGRRQLGRQVDADEGADRRLSPRQRRGAGRRPADQFPQSAPEPRNRDRDDLPGLRALRKHGRGAEHLPRPLAATGPFIDRARMYEEAAGVLRPAQGQRQLGVPEGRKPVGRPPAIGGHRPRHLVQPQSRHPRRADSQPLAYLDRAAARNHARAQGAGRGAESSSRTG